MSANNIDLSAGRKVSINLSAPGGYSMELGGSGTKDHAKLKHLSFEESGHTGFQKELTEEQIAAIEAVLGKEDKANKTTIISVGSTDEQYPSAKAVKEYVAGELEGKEDKIVSPASYFKYIVADNTVTITGLTVEGKAATEINIPPTINDLPVVACAAESFRDNTNLVSVSIPYGVIESGFRQFLGCTNLRSVKLPDSLTNIASHMFYRCTNLTSISIPDSVTAIGDRAFAMCENFKSTVVIPEGITELKERIFTGCVKLKKVVLPKTLKVIEDNMFGGCYELVNIEIPNGVTSIGAVSFYECKVLEELFIPDSVTYIGDRAFELCEKLTIVCNAGSYAEAYAIENGIPYKHTELGSKISLKADKTYVDSSIQSAILESWEVLV